MGTHLATERARLVTLHLTVGAPDFYPSELFSEITSWVLIYKVVRLLQYPSVLPPVDPWLHVPLDPLPEGVPTSRPVNDKTHY